MKIVRRSPLTGIYNEMDLDVTQEQMNRFDKPAHLLRVYEAVKSGEWSFEDFKDFVSVVRNEAKLRTGE